MNTVNVEQRSPEWFALRLGKITASQIHRIMDGGPARWSLYMDELKHELEHGEQLVQYQSGGVPSLDWGIKHEPIALSNYELIHNVDVEQPGFIIHPDREYVGASPDFLRPVIYGEIKCPYKQEIHQLTVMYGEGVKTYQSQIQCGLWCTGFDGAHFVSYDPRYPDPAKQFILIEVDRDPIYIDKMEEKVDKFWRMFQADERPQTFFSPTNKPDAVPTFF